MLDWYIEISDRAPDGFKSDKYLNSVIKTASPCMDYFCKRLIEMDNYTIDDMNNIFSEIIEELPIMRGNKYVDEFIIKYNRWVDIKLTDTTKSIYRDIKIEKLFK
jgi:hypothetical protein